MCLGVGLGMRFSLDVYHKFGIIELGHLDVIFVIEFSFYFIKVTTVLARLSCGLFSFQ